MNMNKELDETVKKLCLLKVGEKAVYMRGTTRWSGEYHNREVRDWCSEAIKSGCYRFFQRLMYRDSFGIGTFEYLVERIK